MNQLKIAVMSLVVLLSAQVNATELKKKESIPTVKSVELDSYLGLWYEISRVENDFQDNEPSPDDGPCVNTTAEYSELPKGKIRVKNTCYRASGVEVAQAKAHPVKGSNNAKLKVNFTGIGILEWLGIGNGDYWILALGEKNAANQYSWVLVGSPKLDFGWVLSRTPNMSHADYNLAMSIANSIGYDINLFKSFQR